MSEIEFPYGDPRTRGVDAGALQAGWRKLDGQAPVPGATAFQHSSRGLAAIRSRDMGRWHLSVSHRDRIPTWAEVGFARDHLLPEDVWLMVAHPPREYWLNFDHRVLHLWEFDDPVLIEQFKVEGEAAQRLGHGRPS